MNFIRRLNDKIFIFQSRVLKFGYLNRGQVWKLIIYAKFQHNMTKIMHTRQKKQGDRVFINTTIVLQLVFYQKCIPVVG